MLYCRLPGKPEPPTLHPTHADLWPVSWDAWRLSPTRRRLWGEIPLLAQVPVLEPRWTWGRCSSQTLVFASKMGVWEALILAVWGNSQPLPRSLGGVGKPGFWLLAGMMEVMAKRLMDGCDVPDGCCEPLPSGAGAGNGNG